jgi:agmatine deiminase
MDMIDFFICPTDRVWTRDSGPLFVINQAGERAATQWRFNGWAKYENHLRDRKVASFIARQCDVERFKAAIETDQGRRRVVLEGGAIDVNGQGSLLTTEECLLSDVQARNPGLDRAGVERVLSEQLGARHVIWLGRGIEGDDTHGHVDDLARFVSPRTVIACSEPDPRDANHAPLADNLARLRAARDQDGNSLDVIELPMPAPLIFKGHRIPASYANFYIGNHAVCVPTFNDPNDRVALSLLARLFPDRAVVGIHAVDLVWGFGTLHCMSQQEPLGTSGR